MTQERRTLNIPPIISLDDHVMEPPDLWQRWLPRKLRDSGPHVVHAPWERTGMNTYRISETGPDTDFWIFGSYAGPTPLGQASAGLGADRIEHLPISYSEMRPGCYELSARLEDMTTNHVERSMCFPTFSRFCGQRFLEAEDRVLGLACVQAYNDWMVEEWCGESGGRLIPLCLVPLWDPELAAAEVHRNADRGVRAVAFTELPTLLGIPSIHSGHWDPFFQACDQTRTVICIHIGSASKFATTSDDAPNAVLLSLTSLNSQMALSDWLFSGVLARFPHVKLSLCESQVGWMPYLLERIDRLWKRGYKLNEIRPEIVKPPSEYFAGRVFGCFFEDDFGIQSREWIGVDQLTFESDYPHQDSTWPNTRKYAEEAMKDLSQEEVDKIVRSNAIKLLDLAAEI
jgi:predicted TIM-barrel fold metal-dependent hydrolase